MSFTWSILFCSDVRLGAGDVLSIWTLRLHFKLSNLRIPRLVLYRTNSRTLASPPIHDPAGMGCLSTRLFPCLPHDPHPWTAFGPPVPPSPLGDPDHVWSRFVGDRRGGLGRRSTTTSTAVRHVPTHVDAFRNQNQPPVVEENPTSVQKGRKAASEGNDDVGEQTKTCTWRSVLHQMRRCVRRAFGRGLWHAYRWWS